jgi:hypothetical protein
MVYLRDQSLGRAIQIAVEALPKLILDSPLAKGTFFHEGSSAARSVLEIHPTDTGFMHLAELLGYYPTLIPDRGTPWEKDARESFPHWHWIKGPWSAFHQNTGIAVHVTPAAIVLQGPATEIVWSNNNGYAGKVDEIAAALLCFKHEITPGNAILICRFEESDELWREKLHVYGLCAREYDLRFDGCSKYARLVLPIPAFIKVESQHGTTPRSGQESETFPPFELSEKPFLQEMNRELWGQSCIVDRQLQKRLTNSKKREKKSSTVCCPPKCSGESLPVML